MIAAGPLFATFHDRRSQKNRLNDELMWCSNTIFMANTLPKLKKVLLELISSAQRKKLFARSGPLARNRTKQMQQCNNQANKLQLPRR